VSSQKFLEEENLERVRVPEDPVTTCILRLDDQGTVHVAPGSSDHLTTRLYDIGFGLNAWGPIGSCDEPASNSQSEILSYTTQYSWKPPCNMHTHAFLFTNNGARY
jgi:hypothetical protein